MHPMNDVASGVFCHPDKRYTDNARFSSIFHERLKGKKHNYLATIVDLSHQEKHLTAPETVQHPFPSVSHTPCVQVLVTYKTVDRGGAYPYTIRNIFKSDSHPTCRGKMIVEKGIHPSRAGFVLMAFTKDNSP